MVVLFCFILFFIRPLAVNFNMMEKKRIALKKLMEAVEKELLHKPNRKTLDRLSLLVGFQNWDSFQDALQGDADGATNYQ